jgi:peptidoglycan/xylan/chitin deacetylase (PgdA/CDA1 family)
MRLERGVFTLSLDLELIWGTLHRAGPEPFRAACEREREEVIDRLLELLEEFELQATWCILGHLMLRSCAPVNGRKHPEVARPAYSWYEADWFSPDPCSDEESAPIYYGRSLVERIRDCAVPQEIGSHSFSHVIFGESGCTKDTAASELAACVRAAKDLGIELRSFAFPGNQVGHLEALRDAGFVGFRGPEPTWHQGGGGVGGPPLKRGGHLADVLFARQPPVVLPVRTPEGLVNIPASMMLFPMHGIRRHIPMGPRVKRATKGLDRAVRERRVFHLWFHPTNLADDAATMFAGLREIFEHVAALREEGELKVKPMSSIGDLAE